MIYALHFPTPVPEYFVQNAFVAGGDIMLATPSTLLIVDDDQATREGLAHILADAGYRILTAGTFERALHTLKTVEIDLLIADVRLGDFNGLQLIATSPTPIRAIVVTGYADKALERDARQLGADYLVKPVAVDRLLEVIERRLHSSSASAPVRRWQRKSLASALQTSVDRWPGRLLDVSYGGVRLEIDESADDVPASLALALPHSEWRIQVDVVWKVRQPNHAWLCGAQLAQGNDLAATAWRDLVDAVE